MPVMARRPKKAATFNIETEVLDQLEALSERLGVKKSDIVRLAVSVAVKRLNKSADEGATAHAALAELETLIDQ